MSLPTPYYDEDGITIYHGDCREVLEQFPESSVQVCVTSPPYWGLRDYGVDGQLGLEATPEDYVRKMVSVFREVRRVLKDDGTVWLNLGDSYAGYHGNKNSEIPTSSVNGWTNGTNENKRGSALASLKPKDLIGIPWRVAFALQADGWYLRQDIIWHKPNPMPESVTDRCTKAHEYIFLLSKSGRYYYDADAIKESAVTGWNGSEFHTGKSMEHQLGRASTNRKPRPAGNKNHKYVSAYNESASEEHRTKAGLLAQAGVIYETRNKRSVWSVNSQPYPEAHFATFPPKLIEPCILAGSRPGDVVLDPFNGSGTTAMVAKDLARRFVGSELNEHYIEMSLKRLAQGVLAL